MLQGAEAGNGALEPQFTFLGANSKFYIPEEDNNLC
jgi:hypothetical protein